MAKLIARGRKNDMKINGNLGGMKRDEIDKTHGKMATKYVMPAR